MRDGTRNSFWIVPVMVTQSLWSGIGGVIGGWMYALNAAWLGEGLDFPTLAAKTAICQFLWTPVVFNPLGATVYAWIGADFSLKAWKGRSPFDLWLTFALPNLLVNVDFTAFDEANWQKACQTFDLEAQAGLTMRLKNGRPVWTGLAGGHWVDLEGARADEGLWQVKIEADYSLGAGRRRVRYLVSRDESEFIPLSDGGNVWFPMGTDGEAFSQVQVAGFGETGEIVAQSGERPLSGTVATVGYELVSAADVRLTEDRQVSPLATEPHFTVTRDEGPSRFYRVRIQFAGL